ncbi:calcium-binding protein [Dankookia sp. P2]|uniref:calcium-binding protein n=1 Tax=Dankookia sp. P2 TaxID=3423955 RepID=UPI003D6744C6
MAGADTAEGLGGADLLLGGRGADLLFGETQSFLSPFLPEGGNDTLLGGAGDDTLFGGQLLFAGARGDGDNLLLGGPGDDRLVGGWGADTVLGGAGDDVILGAGSAGGLPFRGAELAARADGPDLLLGGAGRDSIDGGSGADTILGGVGADTLHGNLGADQLTGGPGADRFVFRPVLLPMANSLLDTGSGEGARDLILDFQQGRDVIDLTGYDSPERFAFARQQALPVNLPEPVFLGQDAFTASFALQVRTEILANGNTLVQSATPFGPLPPAADVVPVVPAGPTGEIELAGAVCLTARDFLLDYLL